MKKGLVSVIIPTYNRFNSLLKAIHSVQQQTYKNIEIIVVNDRSTDEKYYKYPFRNCTIVHLSQNSRDIFGKPSPGGYQRNVGIKIANGEWIAFLDDDDYWLEHKIEQQLKLMKKMKCLLSCSEGYYGIGDYDSKQTYLKYNSEKYTNEIRSKVGEIPDKFGKDLLKKHNFTLGGSSIISHATIIKKAGFFIFKEYADDYEYWLRLINYSEMCYVKKPCVYINGNGGSNEYFKNISTKKERTETGKKDDKYF